MSGTGIQRLVPENAEPDGTGVREREIQRLRAGTVSAQSNGAFDGIFQLPNVAGPVIRRTATRQLPGLSVFGRMSSRSQSFSTKWLASSGMSPGRSRKRRQMNGDNVQAVIQVLAKAALSDPLEQVAVGGRDEPHIHTNRFRTAQALEFTLLQDPQQFRLQFERKVADLIEKQSTALSLFEAADPVLHGARDRPPGHGRRARPRAGCPAVRCN